jgi:peptidoglycan hydrolase CwlO-like protein
MNRDLIEFNKNQGITIDEFGNPTIISKEHNNCSFEEILQKENELETLNNDLVAVNEEYADRKYKLKVGKWCDGVVLLTTLSLASMSYSSVPISRTLIMCGGFAVFGKLLSLSVSGFSVINKKRIKELNCRIDELEDEIPRLEKELDNIKEKVKYTSFSNDSQKDDYQELVFDNMPTQAEEKSVNKVKVLKINN